MEHDASFAILQTLAILLAVGTVMAYVFKWLRLPTVLGFILTGCLIGPYGLQLISDPTTIDAMAKIGILFLLFIVGLELSPSHIRQMRYHAPLAGVLQLALTTIFLTLMLIAFNVPPQLAFLLGSILSLSSTAIVLKSLEDSGESDTTHGRLILGILIIQDFAIVPLMTLVPALSTPFDNHVLILLLQTVLRAAVSLAISLILALRFLPLLFDKLAASHSREIFTLGAATVGLGMAFITGYFGLSHEAGAFMAGLALSGSVYSKQVIVDSRSFRDVFAALFFVSVGLLMDTQFLTGHLAAVLGITALIIGIKCLTGFMAARLTKFPLKASLWTALSLFQVGEFSFILLKRTTDTLSAAPANPHTVAWDVAISFWSPLMINAIVLSMFITPIIIRWLPRALYRFSQTRVHDSGTASVENDGPEPEQVLIAGYGPVAQNLASVLTRRGVRYAIIEMNLNTIKKLKQKKIPCIFGDVSHPDILRAAGIRRASIFVITFPDTKTAEIAIQQAKKINPDITCIARARYSPTLEGLHRAGADQIIYEELESSLSFIFHTLHTLDTPVEAINPMITMIREQDRTSNVEAPRNEPVFGRLSVMADTTIEWIEIKPGSPLAGKTLADSGIRQTSGVNVLSVLDANGDRHINPAPEMTLQPHDVLVVLGTLEQLEQLENLL